MRARPNAYASQKALAALEAVIEAREQALAEVTLLINEASERADASAIAQLGIRFEVLQEELEELMHDWSALA